METSLARWHSSASIIFGLLVSSLLLQLVASFKLIRPSLSSQYTSQSQLKSYGDPDGQGESQFYRWWQETARNIDKVIAEEDPDVPGLTFLSPIEWAPWMETIWFGNYYDYRAAWFHDVMYSNNLPVREGALLFKDAKKAQQVALLYQRYKKFDQSSYSLSNGTFYNLFGVESMRLGRYKIPQTDDVILCTTDPLTYSEMRRYLNSIHALKWFKSLFFQQKRKRQYTMKVDGVNDFFGDAVFQLEYGRTVMNDKQGGQASAGKRSVVHPVAPLTADDTKQFIRPQQLENEDKASSLPDKWLAVKSTADDALSPILTIVPAVADHSFDDVSISQKGLAVPLRVANSQYFLENLAQSLLLYISERVDNEAVAAAKKELTTAGLLDESAHTAIELPRDSALKGLRVFMGGDGRLLNNFAVDVFTRVLAGNNIDRVSVSTAGDAGVAALTTSAALEYLTYEGAGKDCAVVFTAGQEGGGIRGAFGVQAMYQRGDDVVELDETAWVDVIDIMKRNRKVRTIPARSPYVLQNLLAPSVGSSSSATKQFRDTVFGSRTVLSTFDPVSNYVDTIRSEFNLKRIKKFIDTSDIFVTVDCQNSPIAAFLRPILAEIGLEDCILNENARPDFGGKAPRTDASSAGESMQLFNTKGPSMDDLMDIEAEIYGGDDGENEKRKAGGDVSKVEDEADDAPDLGFAFDADAHTCMVFGPRLYLERRDMINALDLLSKKGNNNANKNDSGESSDARTNSDVHTQFDGVRTMLSWLNLLAKANSEKEGSKLELSNSKAQPGEGLVGVQDILYELWARDGRDVAIDLTYTVDEPSAKTITARFLTLLTDAVESKTKSDIANVAATRDVPEQLRDAIAVGNFTDILAKRKKLKKTLALLAEDSSQPDAATAEAEEEEEEEEEEDDGFLFSSYLNEEDLDDDELAAREAALLRRRPKREETEPAVPLSDGVRYTLLCGSEAVRGNISLLAKLYEEKVNTTVNLTMSLLGFNLFDSGNESVPITLADDTTSSTTAVVADASSSSSSGDDEKAKKETKKKKKGSKDAAPEPPPVNISSVNDLLLNAALDGHLAIQLHLDEYSDVDVRLVLQKATPTSSSSDPSSTSSSSSGYKLVLQARSHVPAQTFQTVSGRPSQVVPVTKILGPAVVTAFQEALVTELTGLQLADGTMKAQ